MACKKFCDYCKSPIDCGDLQCCVCDSELICECELESDQEEQSTKTGE